MENIIKALNVEAAERIKSRMDAYYKDAAHAVRWIAGRRTPYSGDARQQLIKYNNAITRDAFKARDAQLRKITVARAFADAQGPENYGKLPNPVIISIKRTPSRTWGYTAHAVDNYGHRGETASGCGYCKTSTALASCLNMHPLIMLRLYTAAERVLSAPGAAQASYRKEIGYGSGHSPLPYFEGGVGVSSLVGILEKIGFSVVRGDDVIVISGK